MALFERQAIGRIAAALLAVWFCWGAVAFAQDEPIIKPKPKTKPNASVSMPTAWRDHGTGLEWTKKDNGYDLTRQQATDYCQNLQLAGHSDWRLATIDELQRIYDPQSNVNGNHVKGNIRISGWQWSSSQGSASGEAWVFDFGGGKRSSYIFGAGPWGRALCVRRSEK